MALGPTVERDAFYAIRFEILPSDARLRVEIERAPDSAGSPDTANAQVIAEIGPLAKSGGVFIDPRAPNGATWWYRFRHLPGLGTDYGPYTAWQSAVATIVGRDENEILGHPGGLVITANIEDQAVALDSKTNFFGSKFFAPQIRNPVNFVNLDFEAGGSSPVGADSGWVRVTGVDADFTYETTSPLAGTRSLKIDGDASAGRRIDNRLEVQTLPGEVWYLEANAKSDTGVTGNVSLIFRDKDGVNIGSIILTWTETTATRKNAVSVAPTNTVKATLTVETVAPFDTDFFTVDQIRVRRDRMRCLAQRSSQSIPNNSTTPIDFTNVDAYDIGNIHDTGTNPSRLVIPVGGDQGLWIYLLRLTWPTNAIGNRIAVIRRNGATAANIDARQAISGAPTDQSLMWIENQPFATDYFEALAFQDSGGALAVTASCIAMHIPATF